MNTENPSAAISRIESVKKYTPSTSSRRTPGPRNRSKLISIHYFAPCFWAPFFNGVTALDENKKTSSFQISSSRRTPGPRSLLIRIVEFFENFIAVLFNMSIKARHA
jgi:hypothetical protein